MKLHFDPIKVIGAKLFGNISRPTFEYNEIVKGKVWACTDLGAFSRPLPILKGVEGVVIMEDRNPEFFLSFKNYEAWAPSLLNRHGPLHHWNTQQDLKELIKELHDQKIKVAIGFWNYGGWGWGFSGQAPFFRSHPEMVRISKSSDMDPFVTLKKEGISYAEFIAHQYCKLQETFNFDGLMLGDGFSGYRSFRDPDLYRDRESTIPQWTDFYATIAREVRRHKGTFLAYDCMGYSYTEAQRHGVNYRDLADAGLDVLVHQSYPQAWGEYWLAKYKDRFDLDASAINLGSVKKALKDTDTKVIYTLELGDSVEKWWADPEKTKKQMERLDPLSDGRFLVWANDLISAKK